MACYVFPFAYSECAENKHVGMLIRKTRWYVDTCKATLARSYTEHNGALVHWHTKYLARSLAGSFLSINLNVVHFPGCFFAFFCGINHLQERALKLVYNN